MRQNLWPGLYTANVIMLILNANVESQNHIQANMPIWVISETREWIKFAKKESQEGLKKITKVSEEPWQRNKRTYEKKQQKKKDYKRNVMWTGQN